MKDVIIIGAGPCGLSAAIECQRQGLSSLIIEKNFIVHSIYLYPTNMQFFSTTPLLEIGDVPFTSPNDKPYRHEALVYYRRAAAQHGLDIAAYEEALSVLPQEDGSFIVHTRNKRGEEQHHSAANVVISTGYFDQPNMIGIPGEELSKVTHYFGEAHPYSGMKVAVIGEATRRLMPLWSSSGSVPRWIWSTVEAVFRRILSHGCVRFLRAWSRKGTLLFIWSHG